MRKTLSGGPSANRIRGRRNRSRRTAKTESGQLPIRARSILLQRALLSTLSNGRASATLASESGCLSADGIPRRWLTRRKGGRSRDRSGWIREVPRRLPSPIGEGKYGCSKPSFEPVIDYKNAPGADRCTPGATYGLCRCAGAMPDRVMSAIEPEVRFGQLTPVLQLGEQSTAGEAGPSGAPMLVPVRSKWHPAPRRPLSSTLTIGRSGAHGSPGHPLSSPATRPIWSDPTKSSWPS